MEEFEFLSSDWPTVKNWLIIGGSALATFMIFLFLARKSRTLLSRRLVKRMDDDLLANFLAGVFGSIVILIGLLIVFRIIGLTGVISGMLAGAGISAFIIGFALKDIGENFLAGILLAFKRPFRVGDLVDIGGIRGTVLILNLRDTQIKTPDGKDVFIPNANIIKNPLVNFTIDGFLRYDFTVGLDYGSDYRAALSIILEAISTVEGVLTENKKPKAWISDLSESTLNLQVVFWVNTFDRKISDMEVKTDAVISVLTALEKAGINMPAQVLEIKNFQGKSFKTA
ncbi:mechanosensitive ion channel family protein [Algoriphagus ratkowskyi]|nr:mechanosensitive ion channel family protein [Algoriphagus ratkowskyi]